MDELLLRQQIALSLIPGLGPKRTREMLLLFQDPMEIFRAPIQDFQSLPFFNKSIYQAIHGKEILLQADKIIQDCQRLHVDVTFIADAQYPHRLKNCEDAPVVLYTQGKPLQFSPFVFSIVGSRFTTPYGIQFIQDFLQAIQSHPVTIVSGLAYGIDEAAHSTCNKLGINNVACLAHGLHTIYPALHKGMAQEIKKNGGLITEYCPGIFADKERFPMRNRLIAGLSDATLVIESMKNGGSMITAQFAQSYNRDLYALPGRITDEKSEGCNYLIQQNIAASITNIPNLLRELGIKQQLEISFDTPNLSENGETLFHTLRQYRELHIDELQILSGLSASHFAAALFELEISGVVQKLPGNRVFCARQV
jgi:DNA processing protein